MRFLTSTINVLMIILVAGMFFGNIPADASSRVNDILTQYEKDLITEEEFEQKLRELQYDEVAIRQAKALIGKLEHQQDDYVPLSESVAKNMEEKPVK